MADPNSLVEPIMRDITAEYFDNLLKTVLDHREQHIIHSYFFKNQKLREIAANPIVYGKDGEITVYRVHQITTNSVRKIALQMMADSIKLGHFELAESIKNNLRKKV